MAAVWQEEELRIERGDIEFHNCMITLAKFVGLVYVFLN